MSISAAPSITIGSENRRTGLRVALWIVQIALALLFGMAGVMKSTAPIPELALKMSWVGDSPNWLVRFIGVSELAGALGLILPSASRIKPGLTPLAALGLLVIMVLAAALHVLQGEGGVIPANLVLGGLAAFVVWGRWKKAPIAPRS